MLVQDAGYLARFDADPADRHLVVEATQELELAVRPPPGEVARAVQPVAGHRAEVVGQETLVGQIRAIEVPAGDR